MRTCKENPDTECRWEECCYCNENNACTYGNSVLCEIYFDQDEYGHCIQDRCSNWDVILGVCTEQPDNTVSVVMD